MPTSFGHALAGVAAAWGADLVPGDRAWRTAPPAASVYKRAGNGLTMACAVLGALPDADLLFGSHRTVTHSVTAAVAVTIVSAAWAAAVMRPRPVLRVALMCGAAYATHILLDYLAVDPVPPNGIQALWPFSHAWYISGWNLFLQTERRHFFSLATIWTNAKAGARELGIITPIAAAIWIFRRRAFDADRSRG